MANLPHVVQLYDKASRKKDTYLDLPKLNPYIENDTDGDILYHIALGNKSHDLPKMFSDVKVLYIFYLIAEFDVKNYPSRRLLLPFQFVVLGGTPKQVEQFAYFVMKEIKYELPPGTVLNNISKCCHRYAMFKVGPVLCVSVSKKVIKFLRKITIAVDNDGNPIDKGNLEISQKSRMLSIDITP